MLCSSESNIQERAQIMASITIENSYQSTNHDMGDNHIKAHKKQHKYLQQDEPLIETLTNNKNSDNSVQLALEFAQANCGLKTPAEWLKYNSKQRKSRQKSNYTEYLLGVSANFQKGKERRLTNPKTNKKTRERISREMRSIITNSGVPIDGTLYYLSNTEMYDKMSPEYLKRYREFERKTLENFYNSDTFQILNPGCIRAEIHYDENGAIHLQTQDIWYHQDSRKRVSYAKRAMIKKRLKALYRNGEYSDDEALNHRLDVLCEFDEAAKKHKKEIGSWRADYQYLDYIKRYPLGTVDNALKVNTDGSKRKYKHSSAERNTRIEELWRIEQMSALRDIAESTAKSMGIKYHVDENYATDGVHLDGAAYIAHKKASQKAQTAMSLANQVKKASESVSEELKSTYKAISGEEPEEQSPLELANKIKSKVKAQQKASEDNQEKIKNQERQIKEQSQELTRLRNERNAISQTNRKLQEENKSLRDSNSKLEERLKYLQQQVQSAGLVIGKWVKRNWKKLEKHFKQYALNINNANNERLHGGKDGKGDVYLANRYEKEAKDGLISALDGVQKQELQKSGFFEKVVQTDNNDKGKDNELAK